MPMYFIPHQVPDSLLDLCPPLAHPASVGHVRPCFSLTGGWSRRAEELFFAMVAGGRPCLLERLEELPDRWLVDLMACRGDGEEEEAGGRPVSVRNALLHANQDS